jgi:hypothetical protein
MRRTFYAALPGVLSMIFNCQACLFQLQWYQMQAMLFAEQVKVFLEDAIALGTATN